MIVTHTEFGSGMHSSGLTTDGINSFHKDLFDSLGLEIYDLSRDLENFYNSNDKEWIVNG
jgi:hypothetical protein